MRAMARISFLAAAVCTFGLVTLARAADPPKITLLDTGKGDKAELRYDMAAETAQTASMSMKMASKQSMGGRQMPAQNLPEFRSEMKGSVTERTDDMYKFTIEMGRLEVIDDGSVPKQVIDMLRQSLPAGTTIRGQMDSRGMQTDAQVEGGQPMMGVDTSNMLSMPFPEQAIGLGAKWTVEQVSETNGLKINQTVTCTLKERKGDVIVIEMELDQSADPQTISVPQMPGAEIEVKEYQGAGKASAKIDLKRLLPLESEVQMTTRSTMSTDMMGQKQDIIEESTLTLTTKAQDVPAKPTP